MEATQTNRKQSIAQLRKEIKEREELLDKLDCEQIQEDLTDEARGVKCISLHRQGMSHWFGKHVNKHSRTAIEQVLNLTFEVAEGEDTVQVDVDMTHMMLDEGDDIETEVYVTREGQPKLEVTDECKWLYQPHVSDDAMLDEHEEKMEKFERACIKEFGSFASTVKKCMDLLCEKRKEYWFVC